MWSDLNVLPPAQRGLSFDVLEPVLAPREQVAERWKPMSADGEMVAHACRNDAVYGPLARLSSF